MKRIFLFFAIFIVIATVLTIVVPSAAEEIEAEPSTAVQTADSPSTPDEHQPFSETVAKWLASNMNYIFSGACAIASAVLIWLFKRGLIPQMASYLGKVNKTVDEAKNKLGEVADGTDEQVKKFISQFTPALDAVANYADGFKAAMLEVQKSKSEKEAMTNALASQSRLILSMIEAARLPESVKEQARLEKVKMDASIAALRAPEEGNGGAE